LTPVVRNDTPETMRNWFEHWLKASNCKQQSSGVSDNCLRDMATKLEKLLEEIDPSRTIDKAEMRINTAFGTRSHDIVNRLD